MVCGAALEAAASSPFGAAGATDGGGVEGVAAGSLRALFWFISRGISGSIGVFLRRAAAHWAVSCRQPVVRMNYPTSLGRPDEAIASTLGSVVSHPRSFRMVE